MSETIDTQALLDLVNHSINSGFHDDSTLMSLSVLIEILVRIDKTSLRHVDMDGLVRIFNKIVKMGNPSVALGLKQLLLTLEEISFHRLGDEAVVE